MASRKHVASKRTLVSRDCFTCYTTYSTYVAPVRDQRGHLDVDSQPMSFSPQSPRTSAPACGMGTHRARSDLQQYCNVLRVLVAAATVCCVCGCGGGRERALAAAAHAPGTSVAACQSLSWIDLIDIQRQLPVYSDIQACHCRSAVHSFADVKSDFHHREFNSRNQALSTVVTSCKSSQNIASMYVAVSSR